MKRIGILFGQERSFPEAFLEHINRRGLDVRAEPASLSTLKLDAPLPYDVLVDRISHEVPFYSAALKQAALHGTRVINNPFWRLADDKYLGNCLAVRLGLKVPKSVLLPQKAYVAEITPESLSNLAIVDWEAVVAELGLPLYLKPVTGGGWKSVSRCESLADLLEQYNKSARLVMMAQENIRWEAYARLLVIGQEEVWIAPWNPLLPHHERYTKAAFSFSEDLSNTMIRQARLLNRQLGYDMNTVEFAIKEGVPYAIDFTNSAPDFDRGSLTPEAFEWVVEKMADLALKRAFEEPRQGGGEPPRWQELL